MSYGRFGLTLKGRDYNQFPSRNLVTRPLPLAAPPGFG